MVAKRQPNLGVETVIALDGKMEMLSGRMLPSGSTTGGVVMNRRGMMKGMAALALCPLCATNAFAEEARWSYEGRTGPADWGRVGNKVCATGTQQSPVDIASTIRAELPKLELAWANHADTIVNNGHTIELEFHEGGTLKVGGDTYKLTQFHFHHPSEHLIDGKPTAMEVHFVHTIGEGNYGVIGALMKAGASNPVFKTIAATMPQEKGKPVKADPAIDPNGLLPAGRNYFRYAGSLTTPPCKETVAWFVLTDPLEVAESDIAAFAKLYPDNARPAQKLNRRFLLRTIGLPTPAGR
jgi:carbonic anhydrase